MNNHLTSSAEAIIDFLVSQSAASLPVFIFALLFSIIFRYKYPKAQHILWIIFLVRLAIPVNYLIGNYLNFANPIALLKLPELLITQADSFYPTVIQPAEVPAAFNLINAVFFVWVSGIILFTIRYFYLSSGIKKIHKNSFPATASSLQRCIEVWRKRLHIKREIKIKFSDVTCSVFNTGIIRPVIILPHSYQELSQAKLDIIIGHECVHIKRFDNLQLLFQLCIRTVYFFNPLVWLATRFLNISREQICDTTVIHEANIPAQFYGNVLLDSIYQPGIAGLNSGFNIHQYIIKQRLLTLHRSQKMNRILLLFLILGGLILSAFSVDDTVSASVQKDGNMQQAEFIQPLKNGRITSTYGMRTHPIYKVQRMHNGIDIAAPAGTPIYATADGLVSFAAKKGGYGNLIIIDHTNGFQTLYGQLSEIKVTQEDQVKRGQLIGLVGSSGISTAPHLHYELRKNGEPLDPQKLIDFIF